MVTLRLFHSANPFEAIESRLVANGEIAVGRDPAADWHIEDAACEVSRRHCAILVCEDGVRVRDTSANAVGSKRKSKHRSPMASPFTLANT